MTDAAMPDTRNVAAARGFEWWSEAWALFTREPGLWIGFGLVTFFGMIFLGLVPFLGSLATALLMPVISGGFMLAARKVEEGGKLEFNDLFAGFGEPVSQLMVLGVAALVIEFVVALVGGVLGAGAVFGMIGGGAAHSGTGVAVGFGMLMLAVLVVLALMFALSMLLWFAPALVVFDRVAPLDAMKTSFAACLANIGPFLLYGILGLVLSIIACIPLGLGMLVLGPLYFLSAYTGYRDIFGRGAAA